MVKFFLHAEEHEGYLQIDIVALIWMVKPSQSFQNSMFTISLLYLKQEVKDEVGYLHADKHQRWLPFFGHQRVLQGDTISIDGHDQTLLKYSM